MQIHGPATAAQNAPVLIDLAPFHDGPFAEAGKISGTVALTPEQKAQVLAGQTYVNVHTLDKPAGELRGQIAPVLMQTSLSGARERPTPAITSGIGSAGFTLAGRQLRFNITYSGLTGPATAAHIHGPGTAEEAVGVLINLAPFHDGPFGAAGSFSGTVTLSEQQLAWVIDRLTYVNIHTTQYPGGEIRGQIAPQSTAVPLTTFMSGLLENPPLTNSAAGSGTLSLEANTLTFQLRYSGLSGTAIGMHIHGPAPASANAPVLIDLAPYHQGPFATEGAVSGNVILTSEQKAMVLSGRTYVNFHTEDKPGGELRGQIAPVLWQTALSGANERPAVVTSGTGSALFALAGERLSFDIAYRDLSGTATAAHIHGPATALQNAGVLVNFGPFHNGPFALSGSFSGTATLTAEQLAALVDGLTYFNVHTPDNPGGEIRGQIIAP
jgi:Cu/Zn superoxide dismutase